MMTALALAIFPFYITCSALEPTFIENVPELFCNTIETISLNKTNQIQTFSFDLNGNNYTKAIFTICNQSFAQAFTMTLYNESWINSDYHFIDSNTSDIYYISVSSEPFTDQLNSEICVSCSGLRGSDCDSINETTNTCYISASLRNGFGKTLLPHIRCDPGYPNCIINVEHEYFVRFPIHCPSDTCASCVINSAYALKYADIYGHHCSLLTIELLSTSFLDSVNIYAPDNGGTVVIPTFKASHSNIYASVGTQNIIIHVRNMYKYITNQGNFINGTSIDGYINYTVSGKHIKSNYTEIMCGKECNINCTSEKSTSPYNTGCVNMHVYAINGTSAINWICRSDYIWVCNNSYISCGYSPNAKVSPLIYSSKHGWYYDSGDCVKDWEPIPPLSCTSAINNKTCVIKYDGTAEYPTQNIICDPYYSKCDIQISAEETTDYSIHCPDDMCTECKISCSLTNACSYAIVFGHHCQTLLINIISHDSEDIRYMKIYAPDNGALIINAEGKFNGNEIYSAPGTHNMFFDFSLCNSCQHNTIYGAFVANDLNVTCTNIAECGFSTVTCPNDAECNILCSGTSSFTCLRMNVIAPEGTNDVNWVCDGDFWACYEAYLHCDNGISKWKYQDSAWIYEDTNCVDLPSESPTFAPTVITIDPTNAPSVPPTDTPTFPPTNIPTPPSSAPTFPPSVAPTNAPTFAPVNRKLYEKINMSKTNFILMLVCASVVFVVSIICLGYCVYYLCEKRGREKKTIYVNNPLVLAICICEYDNTMCKSVPDIEGDLPNLFNLDRDVHNVRTLFADELNYDVYYNKEVNTEYIQITWTEQEIQNFLEEKSDFLAKNIESGRNYDGLIVFVSCHGLPNYLCTSDYRKYEKEAVHRVFSWTHPISRNIPRLFFLDCCSGSGAKEVVLDNDSDEERDEQKDIGQFSKNCKIVEEKKNAGTSKHGWVAGQHNPDYLLGVVNTANSGFQSFGDENGSYFIFKFCEQTSVELENGNGKFLHEILEVIQKDLHDSGKQQIEFKLNNGTNYIRFSKNVSDNDGMIELKTKRSASNQYAIVDANVDNTSDVEGIHDSDYR